MELQEYWGIGPKTETLLAEELGVGPAIATIEAADVRTLVEAGLGRGRATRILRHAHGGAAMELLATRDARNVYKELLEIASGYAVTAAAADRIRVLTPLSDRSAMTDRLEMVLEARDSWRALEEGTRETVLTAFDRYDETDSERAAVRAALELRAADLTEGAFAPLAGLDADALAAAREALAGLDPDGRVLEGADDRLDTLRSELGAVEDAAAAPADALAAAQDARGPDRLREALARHVASETGVDPARTREAMPAEAADARSFVGETLRALATDLREDVDERERTVRDRLETTLADAREDIDRAVEAVDEIAFAVSLARFAIAFELTRPEFVDRRATAVVGARNLSLVDAGESVQPITYAVGDHELSTPGTAPPTGDRVAVLTGANSGGKTTLLETLCQVQLLAQMGLPVPAERAELAPVETIVFHRRHASFNAGVLESTLRAVVPPVTESGRTLMLVDEFEAITEPGRAADLLNGLVTLTVDRGALGVYVTHLAEDLSPLPEAARIDGIFAEGLTADLELEVDYQPRFETVGRSTPEFIVSRLLADAGDRRERAGYEHLADAVGETAVQRTLADAAWSGESP